MNLPDLVYLSRYEATEYIDAVYDFFKKEVVEENLTFLGLPIKCPWHPSYDDKHYCFWHLISEKFESDKEEDRIPDIARCERIRWISYVIQNANNHEICWCWEKSIKAKRGRKTHVVLYLHQEHYVVILRRQKNRFELVTAYTKKNHKMMVSEKTKYSDPRGSVKANENLKIGKTLEQEQLD